MYNLAMFVLSLLVGPLFLLSERGRRRFFERYGSWRLKDSSTLLWFHGASLGEVAGLLPLLQETKRISNSKILVTATSPTGLDKVEAQVDFVRLLPFDCSVWIERALAGLKIERCIITETEIWPGLLRALAKHKIKVSFVNARISERSLKAYGRFPRLFRSALTKVDKILCADKLSYERFLKLGLSSEKLHYLGNSKYDRAKTFQASQEITKFKQELFKNDLPVLTLGSIRPGEDKIWFPAISATKKEGKRFNLIVAPRHKEKYSYFKQELSKLQENFTQRSLQQEACEGILLLDTMGELEKVYSFSALAFIGGSIVDFGGHNPFEALAYGVPVAMGSYRHAVQELTLELEQAGALFTVDKIQQAQEVIRLMCEDPARLQIAGEAGVKVWLENQGATNRILNELGLTGTVHTAQREVA